ncbi:hypothetical protein [Streptomyces sp. NBC_00280]|uniref:hypothetical protein n=1 Tax=Streptomyces sp. NBC_00280 TaxID=2975699 RepID=UPI003248699D
MVDISSGDAHAACEVGVNGSPFASVRSTSHCCEARPSLTVGRFAAPVTEVREGPAAPNSTPSPPVADLPPASAEASPAPAASASVQAATGVPPSPTRNE